MAQSRDKTYHEQMNIDNVQRMREVQKELPAFCKQFFRGIENTTAPRTRLAYALDLRVFFEFLQKSNPSLCRTPIPEFPLSVLEQITKEDIEEFLEYLDFYEKEFDEDKSHVSEAREYTNSERGKSRKLSALRSFYNYFFTSELIEKNVAALVPMPKLHEKEIIRLDPNEVAELLDLVESGDALTENEKRYHKVTKCRDLALLTLLLGTGIRVSECVGLDLNDVDFENCGIHIIRKGGSEAVIYFGDEVYDALLPYYEKRKQTIAADGHENALFLSLQNKRMSVRSVEKLVKKYSSRVTSLKKITPHKLRSTYGTTLYRETGDIYLVADVLGHKSVNTTRKHYAAMEDDNRRKAARVVKLRKD
ncbi:MAG: tyrosine-type recombinase/integrase [Lachnospiraceae bacterium]|nr:tyrosine-type recombinase/integrase [Lachnospiraceae bacterium]